MFELSAQDFQAMTVFLQDLVRTPSPSTQEGEVAAWLADEMRRVGIMLSLNVCGPSWETENANRESTDSVQCVLRIAGVTSSFLFVQT